MGNYEHVPVDYMKEGVILFVEHGIHPGGFLYALLCNDLRDMVFRADNVNATKIVDWVNFLRDEIPASSWGSPANVKRWLSHNGLDGIRMQSSAYLRP